MEFERSTSRMFSRQEPCLCQRNPAPTGSSAHIGRVCLPENGFSRLGREQPAYYSNLMSSPHKQARLAELHLHRHEAVVDPFAGH